MISAYNQLLNHKVGILVFLLFALFRDIALAQSISPVIHYQGRVSLPKGGADVAYDGVVGHFKFAIINASGTRTYWSNDESSADGAEPKNSVKVAFPGKDGVFQIYLGSGLMQPIEPDSFNDPNTFLRVWFSSDDSNFEQLKPNERFSTVPYALRASVAGALDSKSLKQTQLSDDFSGLTLVSEDPSDDRLKQMGFARFGQFSSRPWINVSTESAPLPLTGHSSVIGESVDGIGSMYIWGGSPGKGIYSAEGWVYVSAGDFWSRISPVDAPAGRKQHSAVWANGRMIIWGGLGQSGHLSDGGWYDHSKLSWENIAPVRRQDLSPRRSHSAVWTGSQMLIWGGRNEFNLLSDGMAFDPAEQSWTPISPDGSPSARHAHSVVWTGREMVVWGGQGVDGFLGDGVAYNPNDDSWRKIAAGPKSRSGHSVIWTGSEMIIWGGTGTTVQGNGHRYDPTLDIWFELPIAGGPEARVGHTATWTGAEMVILGGTTSGGETATGYAYSPKKDKWRPLTTVGAPNARTGHSAVWDGTDLVVFGGSNDGVPLSSTQRLNIQPTWYLYRKL